MVEQVLQLLSGLGVPNLNGFVIAPRSDQLSIRTDRKRVDAILVASHRPQQRAGGYIPDLDFTPLLGRTSAGLIPSQPARLTAGPMNLEQMSRSLRSFLLIELSAVFALSQAILHNRISLRKLHFVPVLEKFRQCPVRKSTQPRPFVFIDRTQLENRVLRRAAVLRSPEMGS